MHCFVDVHFVAHSINSNVCCLTRLQTDPEFVTAYDEHREELNSYMKLRKNLPDGELKTYKDAITDIGKYPSLSIIFYI